MDAQNWSVFKSYFKRLEVPAKTLLLAEGQVHNFVGKRAAQQRTPNKVINLIMQ